MIQRPTGFGAFEFAVLSSLRATQLRRGCLPRVDGAHTVAVTAQLEVAQGIVTSVPFDLGPVAGAVPSPAGER